MAKRNRNDFSSSKPVLKPADIAPATHAVLDCDGVEEVEFDNGKRLQLHFSQFPEHVYYLNVTGIDSITEVLGDDDVAWTTQIPLQVVKVMNPQTKKMQDALHVAEPKEWPQLISGARRAVSRSVKKTTRK